jgi:hypothetical protein
LPKECFRGEGDRCRVCEREEKQRAGAEVYRVAPGIIAAPREKWAKELIARLR